ncbi:MAG: hypothetical protein GXP49_02545 [Deltaproteobacteria bacterium]|nr:hypothetical protein [Deltaproteobacteria bacterium]
MKDKRRFQRYRIKLPVTIKDKGNTHKVYTYDISRHGVFLKTDRPKPVRQLLQLMLELPNGKKLEVMGMVARSIGPDEPGPTGPGMGIDFFTLSANAKSGWDDFVLGLKDKKLDVPSTPDHKEPAPEEPNPEEPNPEDEITGIDDLFEEVPQDAMVPDTGPTSQPPPLPPGAFKKTTPPPFSIENGSQYSMPRGKPRFVASFMVRMKDRKSLKRFYTRDISAGGMFVKTPLLKKKHSKVELVILHPETDDEFRLAGTVVRIQDGSDGKQKGLAIRFDDLDSKIEKALSDFIGKGLSHIEKESSQLKEIADDLRESLKKGKPDSIEARAATAFDMLEQGRPGDAIEEFKNCLKEDPEFVAAHKGLKEAFTAMGDAAMAFIHLKELKRLEKKGK